MNTRSYSTVSRASAALFAALLLSSFAGLALQASLQASETDGAAIDAPKSLEEGMARLETLLGRYTDQDNRQWRFVLDDEVRTVPEPEKPIVVVMKGTQTYGVPVQSGNLIAFDFLLTTQRTIFNEGEEGKRTLSRKIQNHQTLRYHLRRSLSGDWFYDAVALSHSIPEFRDRPLETGRVNWLANGIELVGLGTDNFFRQGGRLVTGAFLVRRKLIREGNRLVEALRSQCYDLAKGSDADVLPIPDFSKPFGELFIHAWRSEPLGDDTEREGVKTEIDGTWELRDPVAVHSGVECGSTLQSAHTRTLTDG